jgi:hypothetical protein
MADSLAEKAMTEPPSGRHFLHDPKELLFSPYWLMTGYVISRLTARPSL